MPNPTQPGVVPIWTQGNTAVRTQPTNGEQFAGFVPNFRPPSSWHNWLFGVMSDWIAWLNFISNPSAKTVVGTAPTTLGLPVKTFMGNPSAGSFAQPLPSAAANPGYECSFVNISATNNLTVTVATGDYLQGVINGTYVVGPGESITFASDGATGYWQIQ